MKRYLQTQIENDLQKKMVFLGGPRQVGKTFLANNLIKKLNTGAYLNWDIHADREAILTHELPNNNFLVFDEIHKYKDWRNFLKGLFDAKHAKQKILVTGSAKLDYYRYAGDSLQGRYHYLRLHPLSVAELGISSSKELQQLITLGGFPEPFLSGSEKDAKRWSREYRSRLITEEITSIEHLQDLGKLELLMLQLPQLVASPLSLNRLREDLQVSHKTIVRWVEVLERFYGIFRISPFYSNKLRSVRKEQKHYHLDWSIIPTVGPRFENLVACHLLKWVHYQQDTEGREVDLQYFRDVTGKEVDFVITEDKKPIKFIECKVNDDDINPTLKYLKERFNDIDTYQISAKGKKDYISKDGIRVCPAILLLKDLV